MSSLIPWSAAMPLSDAATERRESGAYGQLSPATAPPMRLWRVDGFASFDTLAWAPDERDAKDAVSLDSYEVGWVVSATELSDDQLIAMVDPVRGFGDLGPEDEVWSDLPRPPIVLDLVDLARDRLAAAKKAAAIAQNGQIPLPLVGLDGTPGD
jgi:hypothetical protein